MTTIIEISKRNRNFGRSEYLSCDQFSGTNEECSKHIKQYVNEAIDHYCGLGFVPIYVAVYGKTTLHVLLAKGDVEDSLEIDSGYTEINMLAKYWQSMLKEFNEL